MCELVSESGRSAERHKDTSNHDLSQGKKESYSILLELYLLFLGD